MIDDARLCGQVALGGADFSLRDERDDVVAIATIRAAADAGIRIFDSGRAYATVDDPFHNERLFAAALAGRDDVLIATKGGHWRAGVAEWAVDNSPDRLRRDVDDSLRSLSLDRLGLYYVHRADAEGVPLGESIGALDQLRREGKITGIGVSNVTRSQLDDLEDPTLIVAVQNRFGVGATHRREVIDWCEMNGVTFFAYSPLGGADLGRSRETCCPDRGDRIRTRRVPRAVAASWAPVPLARHVGDRGRATGGYRSRQRGGADRELGSRSR